MDDVIARRIASEPKVEKALWRLLAFCEDERDFEEIVEEVSAYPEVKNSPFAVETLLSWLIDAGAVQRLRNGEPWEGDDAQEDSDAAEVLAADAESEGGEVLPEEGLEISDLNTEGEDAEEPVVETFVISEAGAASLAEYRAADPIADLRIRHERYEPLFAEILAFCRTPQAKAAIDDIVRGNPLTENPRVLPAFFIDQLERAGALIWDGGWKTTEAGEQWLSASTEGR